MLNQTHRKLTSLFVLLLVFALAAPATFAQERRSRFGPKTRAALSAGAGAGIGAAIGGLVGGKRGAGAGALLGGGGATTAWLLKNKRDRNRLGKYGKPIAYIGSGAALGGGLGTALGGKKGAAIGAGVGGGGTAAGYYLNRRNKRNRYYSSNRVPRRYRRY